MLASVFAACGNQEENPTETDPIVTDAPEVTDGPETPEVTDGADESENYSVIEKMSKHENGWVQNNWGNDSYGVYFNAKSNNAPYSEGGDYVYYRPVEESCIILVRDGESYELGNVFFDFLLKQDRTGYYLRLDEMDDGRTFGEAHPEWFVDPSAEVVTLSNNQLCWTASGDEESLELMQTIAAEKMLEYTEINDLATFFMLGQMDTEYVCNCQGCTEAIKQWGGSANGLQIAFVNKIIEKTEALLDQTQPDREILYAVYAYKPTEAAPVKTDSDGKLVPYSDKVIPHEKMRIFFAPIRLNYAYPMDAPYNSDSYTNLKGWDAVCDKDQLIAYVYDLNVSYYFANWYNFRTLSSIYTDLKEAGITYLVSQGVSDTSTICFDELRAYVISQLMWDTEQSFDALAEDFIDHYYKDAADSMQELFELIDDRYAYYAAAKDPGIGSAVAVIYSTELWPRPLVEQMDRCIMESMDAIAHLEETDPEQYELLKARIMKEYLSNIYLKVALYKDFYTDSEIAEMKEIWEYYLAYWNISKGGEGYAVTDIFA